MVDNLNQWFAFQAAHNCSTFIDFPLRFVKGKKMEILAKPWSILEAECKVLQVGTFWKVLDDGPSNPKNTNFRMFGLLLIEF